MEAATGADKPRGKFIVIDGTDGAGKATQTELLIGRLKRIGYRVETADFPQYNTKSAGPVEKYLSGQYGRAEDVGPYAASILYAVDRYDASFRIRGSLRKGAIVVANRYVSANMGHQGGKISSPEERRRYYAWLDKLEYGIFRIPRPDLNIILHMPAAVAQSLAQAREKIDWKGKTKDIHQDDLDHLKRAEEVYLELAREFPDFALIECAPEGEILSRERIAGLVWEKVKRIIPAHGE